MKGFIYRFGVSIKDTGENLNCGLIIRLGLAIRDFVAKIGVK